MWVVGQGWVGLYDDMLLCSALLRKTPQRVAFASTKRNNDQSSVQLIFASNFSRRFFFFFSPRECFPLSFAREPVDTTLTTLARFGLSEKCSPTLVGGEDYPRRCRKTGLKMASLRLSSYVSTETKDHTFAGSLLGPASYSLSLCLLSAFLSPHLTNSTYYTPDFFPRVCARLLS